MRFEKFVGPVVVVLAMLILGCSMYKTKGKTPAANQAVNSFEDYSFRILLDAGAGLEKTRQEILDGKLPPSVTPIFDRAVVVYNNAVNLTKSYDTIVRSGGDPQAVRDELTNNLSSLVVLIAELRPSKNPAPATAPVTAPTAAVERAAWRISSPARSEPLSPS